MLGTRLEQRPKQALGQSLVMTPQLQQAIRLLALSNLEVGAFISDALDRNPLLDLTESPADSLSGPELAPALTPAPSDTGDGAFDLRAVSRERAAIDQPAGTRESGRARPDGAPIGAQCAAAPTLADHLLAQLGATARDADLGGIARYLIGLLDEAGYLAADVPEIATALGLSPLRVEAALALVQTLDPCGVGARSLAECITLQAREADRWDPAMATLINHLELVARGEFVRLKRLCGVDDEDLSDMLGELRGYDPKPGLRIGPAEAAPVIPDILIAASGANGWDLALNPATLPRLIVNRAYYVELRGACADRTARGWLSERLADANWLVKTLDQRQRTILTVASEIVRRQEGFFRCGVAQLKPLTLRTVADAIGLHESTVSRVTANKYLNCPRGTFELKYFFTSGVAANGGESTASAEAVKAAIRQLIDGERAGGVFSDDALVELLRARGFDLARRTVAKYREAIGLGSSVHRRRQKALAQMV